MSAMRAVTMHSYGDPSVLRWESAPIPVPHHDQVLVKVLACGVCGHDLLARRGALGTPLPAILGHEIAGRVVEVGASVSNLHVGDRVALVQRIPCGRCSACLRGRTNMCRRGPGFYGDEIQGGYAEYVVASELNAVRLPENISDTVGAILSCGVGTGLRALKAAELHPGDTVVVTGAGGGVGFHTVEVARALGYRTLAVTSSPDKVAALEDARATAVLVLGRGTSIRDAVRSGFSDDGADAVIEVTGAPTFVQSLAALRGGGRVVIVGNTAPRDLVVNPGLVILKELVIRGSAHAVREDLEQVVELVGSGAVSPIVSQTCELSGVPQLHTAMEARTVLGRCAIVMGEQAK